MWSAYAEADHFLFTGNGSITSDKRLVMGRGMAKQVRDKFPGIDHRIAEAIRYKADHQWYEAHWVGTHHAYLYRLLLGSKVGVFQVKWQWSEAADLKLIDRAAHFLKQQALTHPHESYHLNYPGIGNGRLPRGQVQHYLDALPDNVFVWEFPKDNT